MADENPTLQTSIATPPVPELDSTPISAKPKELPARRGSVDDKELAPEVLKQKQEKLSDPAVLVNIPTTPSAQAYEIAQKQVTKTVEGEEPTAPKAGGEYFKGAETAS